MKIDMYYTYEYDGEIFDHEFITKAFAEQSADKWWDEKNADNECMNNGDTFEEDIHIIAFYYHPETGERVIDEREEYTVIYEHYHGDFREHNTLYRGGVL